MEGQFRGGYDSISKKPTGDSPWKRLITSTKHRGSVWWKKRGFESKKNEGKALIAGHIIPEGERKMPSARTEGKKRMQDLLSGIKEGGGGGGGVGGGGGWGWGGGGVWGGRGGGGGGGGGRGGGGGVARGVGGLGGWVGGGGGGVGGWWGGVVGVGGGGWGVHTGGIVRRIQWGHKL